MGCPTQTDGGGPLGHVAREADGHGDHRVFTRPLQRSSATDRPLLLGTCVVDHRRHIGEPQSSHHGHTTRPTERWFPGEIPSALPRTKLTWLLDMADCSARSSGSLLLLSLLLFPELLTAVPVRALRTTSGLQTPIDLFTSS